MRSAAWLAGGMSALLLLATLAGRCAAQAGETGFTLDQLMKLLAQRKQGRVGYVEKDYYTILDQPVTSSGVLVYRAPDHLEKKTLQPKKASLVLEGDELTVQRGHRTYRMQLSAYPQVAPLVNAIRDTLAGNEQALEKAFEVGFSGTMAEWKLGLVPLDKQVAGKVSRVEIAGTRDEIRSVEVLQVGGDRSVMTLGAPGDTAGAGQPP